MRIKRWKTGMVLAAVLAGLVLVKNPLLTFFLQQGLRSATGLSLRIKSLRVDILRTRVDIRELRVFNPGEFQEKLMAEIPAIYMDYDFWPLLTGKLRIRDLKFDLAQLVVIKNGKKEINLEAWKTLRKPPDQAPETAEKVRPKKALDLHIDTFRLKIRKVVYLDYSHGTEPSVAAVNVNLDETFKNITDLKSLMNLILFKATVNTTFGNLINLDMVSLKNIAGGALKSAAGLPQDAVETTEDALKTTGNKTIEITGDVLKKTKEGVKGILRLPFDKNE